MNIWGGIRLKKSRKVFSLWMAASIAVSMIGPVGGAAAAGTAELAQDAAADKLSATWQTPASDALGIRKIASYSVGTSSEDGGVAEIVRYNQDNGKFYLINGSSEPASIDIVPLKASGELTKESTINVQALAEQSSGFTFGDLTSIDINTVTQQIAVAVQEADANKTGKILLLDYAGKLVKEYPTGVQPDMVKFTSDGRYILTADEGEPRVEGIDPEGSVTVVDTKENQVKHVKFDNPAVIDDKVHIRGTANGDGIITGSGSKADAVTDLEPEYIALSGDEKTAYVSLQENNAIAAIDIAAGKVISVKGLGFKDLSDPRNSLDLVEDGEIRLENVPFLGMYMPDGIDAYTIDGKTYLFTANEGDATEWDGRVGVTKLKDLAGLNPESKAGQFLKDSGDTYDDVEVATDMGPDGVYMYGARSFSIWNADDMKQVYDSGNEFEKITSERLPDVFNSNHSKVNKDKRSPKKGPEPEYITVGEVDGKLYAFTGLERIGGVMAYDVTNPEKPQFAAYLNPRDFTKKLDTDTGPEGLEFIPAEASPTNRPLLLVANEVSGTVAVLELGAPKAQQPASGETWKLTVMHTNDTHAHLAEVARRATLVKQIREEEKDSLLLDAGDVFSGDLYFTKWFGLADLSFMNMMGYDAMTFGNHEFDQGTGALAEFVKNAQFPLVSSNIDFSTNQDMLPLLKSPTTLDATASKTTAQAGVYPYVVLDVNGHQVGVFGLTTEDTAETSGGGKAVKFNDATASAAATVAAMEKEGLNIIIALSHLGYARDQKLALDVEGIDLIVGGHTHTKLDAPEIVVDDVHGTPTAIVQANEWGKFLGRVDVVFDSEGVVLTGPGQTTGHLIAVDPEQVAEDAKAKEVLAPYNEELEEMKKQPVGQAAVVLDGVRENVRSKETNLGNLIADGMLEKARQLKEADVALMNGGGIRAAIDEGEITMGELRTVMPFGNTLFVLDVTGQQLKNGLENGISGAKSDDLPGKFPQIAGMTFKWDPAQPEGGRVFDVQIKQDDTYTPLKLSATYRLATNSFVATGGDGYTSFAEAIEQGAYHEDLGYPDYEIFMEHVERLGGTVNPSVEGRITEQAKPAGEGNESPYDYLEGHWAQAAVEALNSRIPGLAGSGTFVPDQAVQRGEFVSWLTAGLDLEPDASANSYTDVSGELAGSVGAAVKAGILTDDKALFAPEDKLGRAEMSVMTARALRYVQGSTDESAQPDVDALSRYKDQASIPGDTAADIAWLTEQNILQGDQHQLFGANESATRAQAAVILMRLLQALDVIQ